MNTERAYRMHHRPQTAGPGGGRTKKKKRSSLTEVFIPAQLYIVENRVENYASKSSSKNGPFDPMKVTFWISL